MKSSSVNSKDTLFCLEALDGDVLILQEQEVASFPVTCGISFAWRSEWHHADDPTLLPGPRAPMSQLTPAWDLGSQWEWGHILALPLESCDPEPIP